jgi:parallel beta-helix repeat protein
MKAYRALVFVAAVVAAVIVPAAPAFARTWVVDAANPAVECPDADYASINAAVAAPTTLPGDTIIVCPGLYPESVNVPKPGLTLKAENRPDVNCFDPAALALDPTRDSIVDGVAHSFSLSNDRIELDGFVIQGSVKGVLTSTLFSGYDIRNNLVRLTNHGIDHNASGAFASRVHHNCLRQNFTGHASETGDLRNARIDHNDTFSNTGAGIDASGAGTRVDVRIDHNRSRQDLLGFLISNSRDSELDHNLVDPSLIPNNGIVVSGGNVDLEVQHNEIGASLGAAAFSGMVFNQAGSVPVFPVPSVDLVVSHNLISGRSNGILLQVNSADASTFSHNMSVDNTMDGIRLSSGNNDNLFEYNQADRNGRDGIRVLVGAVANTFAKNAMFDNVEHDAHDDNRPANVWTGNKCDTDFPAGTICGQ